MKDCFLSPEGDVFYGHVNETHQDIADYIVKTVYKIDIVNDDLDIHEFEKYRDSKRFLVKNGWIEYINHAMSAGGLILVELQLKLKLIKFMSLLAKSLKIKIYCDRAYDYARSFF